MFAHISKRPARIALATALAAFSETPLSAQASIGPSVQSSAGSSGMIAGVQEMLFAAPQAAVGVAAAGANMIQSGFYGFLEGDTFAATAQTGQAISEMIASGAGTITLYLPPNGVPAGTQVSIQLPLVIPPANGAGLTAVVNTAVQVNSTAQPLIPATLTFSYASANMSGIDPRTLVVARYDAVEGLWVPLVSTVDPANAVVSAQTRHFSLFQVMQQSPSASVAAARAFPNPLRPSQGQGLMTFTGLPANARIRIYGLKGVLIKDLTANASGMASWDGTNQAGAPVASGVYYVFAQGAGEKRTFNVAVER